MSTPASSCRLVHSHIVNSLDFSAPAVAQTIVVTFELFMAALRSRCRHYIFALWFLSFSFFLRFSSPNLSRRRLDVYHTSAHGVALSVILGCRSETYCTRLAENTGRKKSPKIAIEQFCRAISSQLRHISTIGKKPVIQQFLHMSSQYGELRPTNG